MAKTQETETVAIAAPKLAIPNIARLTDDQLRAALRKHGQEPGKKGRANLIRMARDAGLWDYKGDVVPAHYKKKYGSAQNCGDGVAVLLVCPKGCDAEVHLAFLADVADANGIRFDRWAHCNFGQKIMNLGNVLRGMIKRGEYVVIGTDEWNIEAA